MRLHQIVAAADALTDEQIAKWPPVGIDLTKVYIVHNCGPITDRKARSFLALQRQLGDEMRSYAGKDRRNFSPEASEHIVGLQSSLELLQAIVAHEVSAICRQSLPPELRERSLQVTYGENWSIILIDPTVVTVTIGRSPAQTRSPTSH